MIDSEVELLGRAHQLFAGRTCPPRLDPVTVPHRGARPGSAALPGGEGQRAYRLVADHGLQRRLSAARTDGQAAAVIVGAHRDRARAHELTRGVLDEARADAAATALTPMARREAVRRRVGRLRAQRAHVLAARSRARRRTAALRALRYRLMHRRKSSGLRRVPDGRAVLAVRAALSRLGRPYVWGATGPDQFDCSGLVRWSYAQAGIHLDRTTYQQIHDGVAVPRSQVRPGDLVFPHAGHVQLAIGDGLVVEAPHAGAPVRISPLGSHVQIRRPL